MATYNNNTLWEQAARYLAGEMTANEEADFLIEVKTYPEKESWFNQVKEDWKQFESSDDSIPVEDNDENQAWSRLVTRIENSNAQKSPQWYNRSLTWVVAASISLLIVFAGYLAFYQKNTRSIKLIQAEKQQTVTLPDGSIVFLNTHSTLAFSKEHFSTLRQVTLAGEAYFEVQKDPAHPFEIKAGSARVKVLGTSFNVQTLSAQRVEVNVKTGKVEVSISPNQQILLFPGDCGQLRNGSLIKSQRKNENYLAWKTHQLVFEGENLEEALRLISKVYQVPISTQGLDSANYIFSHTSFNSLPLETVLQIIESAFSVKAKKQNGQWILYAK